MSFTGGKGTLTPDRPKIYPEFPLRALAACQWRPSSYLQGIDPEETIRAVRTRGPPMMCAGAGLRL
jgi:hypothetical protein